MSKDELAMKRFEELVDACRKDVEEIFPWDLAEQLASTRPPLLLDVREPYEFEAMHIKGSLLVPRGVLESAAEWGYEETVPALVQAREQDIVVICRAGNRSLLAGKTLKTMGYERVASLKTGLRGWNDYEQPLVDGQGRRVSQDASDTYFTARVTPEQLGPGA
jgi:rhodanese-related sulfurtransferase